jgi:hypothetical protein
VEEWELAVQVLRSEFEEKLSPKMQMAILTSILPADLQDFIFQQATEKDEYHTIRDRVMALARNRVSMATPTPMEIGNVGYDWQPGEGGEDYEGGSEDVEVDAIYRNSACARCGGLGHWARECGTPKGKGKGKGEEAGKGGYAKEGKGGGKGYYGKGGDYGKGDYGKGGGGKGYTKGFGKGFQGNCYHCQKKGHRAAECPNRMNTNAVGIGQDEGHEEEEVGLGSIWVIGHVGKIDEEGEAKKTSTRRGLLGGR